MKHHSAQRKLGRVRRQRTALLRSLARSLILHGRIETTEAKAKELRPFVERLVTSSKEDTLSARRLVAARLGNSTDATARLFDVLGPRFKERSGGYTRITKLGFGATDARRQAAIEFVDEN